MSENTSNPTTLLSVLAHPDDESFGMGGTLALYARQGVAVQLVCATRGEAGDVDEQYLQGYASIGDRREAELRCAAMKLGLAGVHFLGYRDSGMTGSPDNNHPQALANAPLDEVARKVVHYIRQLRPQVLLTFDPIGGYKHPDHIAVHKATVQAFELAGREDVEDGLPPFQPQRMYFHFFPRGYLRFAVRVMPLFGRDPRHFGRNGDVDLVSITEEGDFPVNAVINYRAVTATKDAASQCHASQIGGPSLRRGPMHWAQVLFGQKDYFMRGDRLSNHNGRVTDLFAGI